MGNCCQGLSNKIRTVLRINVPTGDASQTNSSDEVNQRQPILKKTPPIIGEESSSADEKGLVSPLLKGNGVTKVYEALSISPRNDEDEKKAKVKETKPPAKRTYSRTAQKSKQQSTRPKYKEVSTDADDDSEDEVVPNRISKPNPILSNKDFQPAPTTSLSKKKRAKESDKESDGEYDPEKDSE